MKENQVEEFKEPLSNTTNQQREKLIELANSQKASKCSYSDGYITQAVYSCLTCQNSQKEYIGEVHKQELMDKFQTDCDPAAICLGCALNCHQDHDLVFVHRKANIRCDCGNSKMMIDCKLNNQKDFENEENAYCHNYFNQFCTCNENYEGEEFMIQCEGCFQWFHLKHAQMEKYQQQILRKVHQVDDQQKGNANQQQKQNSSKASNLQIKNQIQKEEQFSQYEEMIEYGLFYCQKCKSQKVQYLEVYLGLWKFMGENQMKINEVFDIISCQQTKEMMNKKMKTEKAKSVEDQNSKSNQPIKDSQYNKCIIQAIEQFKTQAGDMKTEQKDLTQIPRQNQSLKQQRFQLNKILLSKLYSQISKIPNDTSIVISRNLNDYCNCTNCYSFLEPLISKLLDNQIDDCNILLEELNQEQDQEQDQEQEQQKIIKTTDLQSINHVVGKFSQNIFNKIESQNNEQLPVTVKHLAMNHFKNIFEEMKAYIQSGQESIQTKQGMQKFLSSIKSKSLNELYEEEQQKRLQEQQQKKEDQNEESDCKR